MSMTVWNMSYSGLSGVQLYFFWKKKYIYNLCVLYLLKVWKYYYWFIFIIIHKYMKILFIFQSLINYPISNIDLIKIIQKVEGTNDTPAPTFQKVVWTCPSVPHLLKSVGDMSPRPPPPATPMYITNVYSPNYKCFCLNVKAATNCAV